MQTTTRLALTALVYLMCVIGAYMLVPGPFGVLLVCYTIVVWLGGVSFLKMTQEWKHLDD